MPLKILRNDITKMSADAIVNTANAHATVGSGCDHAIYHVAGYDELLKYRTKRLALCQRAMCLLLPDLS